MADIPFDLILTLAQTVVTMGLNVKANKERCQRVAQRVMNLQELVLKIRDRDPRQLSEVVQNALKQLSATLVNARDMMRKNRQSNAVKSFIFSSSYEDNFSKINERLDDAFQILSGAMQIQQVDMLDQVLSAVTGKAEFRAPPPYSTPFFNTCTPAPSPGPSVPMPSPGPSPPVPLSLVTNVTSPTNPFPQIVPAISVTEAPPYPPAQTPAFNPNFLTVPAMPAPAPCAMPPRVVTSVRPIVMQGTAYGTFPTQTIGATAVMANPTVRTAPPVVYAQALRPPQVIVTVSAPPQVLASSGAVTVVVNRPY